MNLTTWLKALKRTTMLKGVLRLFGIGDLTFVICYLNGCALDFGITAAKSRAKLSSVILHTIINCD